MYEGEIINISCGDLTEKTLEKLIEVANEQKSDMSVRKTAEKILATVPEKNWTREIEAVFNYVKNYVRYTRDISGVEFFRTPLRHIADINTFGRSQGDCDDMSLLLATLLMSAGYKVKYVIIRTAGNPVNSYNHIYVEVLHPSERRWIALDATMKDKPFGWLPQAVMRKDFNV